MSLSTPRPWDLVAPGYAEYNLASFTHFAERALDRVGIGPTDRVLDVCAGPGSLAVPAARRAARVDALDFSEPMLAQLRARAADLPNLHPTFGDGQALPWDDDTFDVAFSMFGLMFFPDRAAGFRELARVLVPGGRAVVASWVPMAGIPLFRAMFEALFTEAPSVAPAGPPVPPPLSSPDAVRTEMGAAGFDVVVEEVVHTLEAPTLRDYWAIAPASFAPLCLVRESLGDAAFADTWERVLPRMERAVGPGAIRVEMRALFGVGALPT